MKRYAPSACTPAWQMRPNRLSTRTLNSSCRNAVLFFGRQLQRQGSANHHEGPKAPCPLDRVNRVFKAERPNQLWVSDLTYLSTWQGWLYVAFALDALEQALYNRQPERDRNLVHHSDRGSRCVAIRYSERLGRAGIEGPLNGWLGLTNIACSNPLDTSHLHKLRQTTTGNSPVRPPWWRLDLNQPASAKPGAIHR